MIEYIYFVKCPNCEDEPFNFFNEAKEFALGCLGNKPIITQVEVNRNDFGECTDSCDLGTIWSWEDVMSDVSADEPAVSVFTHGDFAKYNPDNDPEFTALDNTLDAVPDNFRRPTGLNEAYYAVIEVDGKEQRFPFDTRDAAREYLNYVRAGKDQWLKGKKIGSTYTESCAKLIAEDADPQLKTWICWYEGNDIGTVEASTKEEAEEAMMTEFPEYQYNNTDWGVEEAVSEVCHKKPIPEGMTIEQLVEEMEENEDTVECKVCSNLYDKSECRHEEKMGWLCYKCQKAIESREGKVLVFDDDFVESLGEDVAAHASEEKIKEAGDSKSATEYHWYDGDVELKYEDLWVEYGYGGMVDNDWYSPPEPRHWFEGEVSHIYDVSPEDVADFLYESCLEDEDVTEVSGGLEALEDDVIFNDFMEKNFDNLVSKYYTKILDYWREDAAEDYIEKSAEEEDYGPDPDRDYEERRDSRNDQDDPWNAF